MTLIHHRFSAVLLSLACLLLMPTLTARAGEDAVLNGRVLAPDGQTGVAAYSLSLLDARGRIMATTYPDDEGRFGFSIRPGTYVLRAIADLPWVTEQQVPVTLAAGEQLQDLILREAPVVIIDVRNELGEPIAGARIVSTAYVGRDETITGADGVGRLRIARPGGDMIHFSAPGHLARTVMVAPEGRPGITLARAARVTGRVTGAAIPRDQPLRAVFESPGRARYTCDTVIRSDGSFVIDGLDSAAGRLVLQAPGLFTRVIDGVVVERPKETEISETQATPEMQTRIQTMDSQGRGVAGAHLTLTYENMPLFQWTGDTDEQGSITFGGLPIGRYSIHVLDRAGWCSADETNIILGEEDLKAATRLTVPILRSVEVVGTFTWPDGRVPQVPGVLQITGNSMSLPVTEQWTAVVSADEPGRFSVKNIRPGRWRLHFQVDNAWALLESVVVEEPKTPGGIHDLGEIPLTPVNAVEPPRG
ncbi:MAG: carboxypeptidase regulatory-like domain-containing protein [Phycisphaerales bacterium]|nr:carboxypeptidase regulatory-like domain-containing protein [Phycisphaerales bacterium]